MLRDAAQNIAPAPCIKAGSRLHGKKPSAVAEGSPNAAGALKPAAERGAPLRWLCDPERLIARLDAVVLQIRPGRRFETCEQVVQEIRRSVAEAPPNPQPATARQIGAVQEMMREAGLEDLGCHWDRDCGTAGLAVRLMIEGRRQMPDLCALGPERGTEVP